MYRPRPSPRALAILCLAGLVVLLSFARFVFEANHIAAGPFSDFPLFWQQFREYVLGDPLYPHALEDYSGGAPVYKFPPFYASLLVPFARLSVDHHIPLRDILHYHWVAHIVSYGLTLLVLCLATYRWILLSKPGAGSDPRRAGWIGVAIVLAFGLNFEPFFETLYGLQVETALLLLVAASFWFYLRRQDALAGVFLAVAAMLKLYPGFLVLAFLLERRFRAAAWFVGTCVGILIWSVVIVGPEEAGHYFFRVMPFMLQAPPALTQGNEADNLCLAKYIHWMGFDLENATRIAKAGFLGMLGGTGWVAYRHRRRDPSPAGSGLRYLVFVPLMLAGLSDSWLNYQLILLVPMAWVAGRCFVADRPDPTAAYLMLAAYIPTMINANTNTLLSIVTFPNEWYQREMDTRVLTTLLVWGSLMWLLTRQTRNGAAH